MLSMVLETTKRIPLLAVGKARHDDRKRSGAKALFIMLRLIITILTTTMIYRCVVGWQRRAVAYEHGLRTRNEGVLCRLGHVSSWIRSWWWWWTSHWIRFIAKCKPSPLRAAKSSAAVFVVIIRIVVGI